MDNDGEKTARIREMAFGGQKSFRLPSRRLALNFMLALIVALQVATLYEAHQADMRAIDASSQAGDATTAANRAIDDIKSVADKVGAYSY